MDKKIFTIKQLAEKHPFLTESSIRWMLYKNEPGLEECLIRNSRRIFIVEDSFMNFLSLRILKRMLQKNWHIPDLAEGCTKSVRFRLIKYMLRFQGRYGLKINELRQKYPQVCFYVFRSDKKAAIFLDTISSIHKCKTV